MNDPLEMSHNECVAYLKNLKPEELQVIPFEIKKWTCCVEGCKGFTRIKDFGISPIFLCFRKKWINLEHCVFYCSKHWPLCKKSIKLKRNYQPDEGFKPGAGIEHVTENK